MKLIILVMLTGLISACSGVIMSEKDGKSYYYEMTEDQAKQCVGKSIAEVMSGLPILTVDFPHPGYSVQNDNGMDSHNYMAYYIKQNAKIKGKATTMYWFKVEHSGDHISGSSNASDIFKRIEEKANKISKPIFLL